MKSLRYLSIFLALGIASALVPVRAMEQKVVTCKLNSRDYYDENRRDNFLNELRQYYRMVLEIAEFIRTTIVEEDSKTVSFRLNSTLYDKKIIPNGGLALNVCRYYLDLWTPLGSLRIWKNKGDEFISNERIFMSRFRTIRHKLGLIHINKDNKTNPTYIVTNKLPIALIPTESDDDSYWIFGNKFLTLEKSVSEADSHKYKLVKKDCDCSFLLEGCETVEKIWKRVKPKKKHSRKKTTKKRNKRSM